MNKKCYRFTEHNDWEGETWHAFIDMTDEQHAKLKEMIKDSDAYDLSDIVYDSKTVNTLVENAEEGYFDSHSYLGELVSLPETFDVENDPFYKCGIDKFCKYVNLKE